MSHLTTLLSRFLTALKLEDYSRMRHYTANMVEYVYYMGKCVTDEEVEMVVKILEGRK